MVEPAAISSVTAAFVAHRPALTATARRHCAGDADAEDAVQDVFLTLWSAPERFDATRACLPAYLRMAARGRAIDRARADRSRRDRQERAAAAPEAPPPAVDDLALDRALQDRACELLLALPVPERQAIAMAFFGGRAYRDVALSTGIPEGTVKARIRTGLARLRTQLLAEGFAATDLA